MSGIKVDLRMKPLAQEPRFVAMLQWGWSDLGVAHSQGMLDVTGTPIDWSRKIGARKLMGVPDILMAREM
jgi:hypothetical protein